MLPGRDYSNEKSDLDLYIIGRKGDTDDIYKIAEQLCRDRKVNDEQRRFRHVFRAQYGSRLNPDKIYRNVSRLKELHQLMEININSFLHKMDALVSIDDLNNSAGKEK